MATGKSGYFDLTKNWITLRVKWSETYDPVDNKSVVSITAVQVKSTSWWGYVYYPGGTIKVNGNAVITFDAVMGYHNVYIGAKNDFYNIVAHKNFASKAPPWSSGQISHASDGSKSVAIEVDIAGYTTDGEHGSGWKVSGSKTIELTDIDRAAPTISISTSNVTINSFKISASSNAKCDKWYYSLDNGETWTSFSTTSGTSASATVTGLTVNTSYKVKVKARRAYNHVYGTSSAKTVKTLGYTLFNSCAAFFVDESTARIKPNVTVYDRNFTHTITIYDSIDPVVTISNLQWLAGTVTESVALTSSQKKALLERMSTVTSKSFMMRIATYNGTTLIGRTERNVTAKTSSANSAPTFTGFSYEDISELVELTGNKLMQIQGYSSLKVTATAATAKNGAKIASYTATIASKTVKSKSTEIDVGAVSSSGKLKLTVSAVDSRGYATSITKNVQVLPYSKPKITQITLRRANGIDAEIQLAFTASMSVIQPGGTNDVNSLVNASYRYKLTSAGDDISDYSDTVPFTSRVVRSDSGTTLSFETNELLSLDTSKSYDFRLVVKDKVASSVTYYVIPKGIPLIAARKDKVGINNPDPKYALDVAGSINLTGDIYINGKKLSEVLGL